MEEKTKKKKSSQVDKNKDLEETWKGVWKERDGKARQGCITREVKWYL